MRIALSTVVLVLLAYDFVAAATIVDPDAFSSGTDISAGFPGVTLSLEDGPGASGPAPQGTAIYSQAWIYASTGTNVFSFLTTDDTLRRIFVRNNEGLRADFVSPVAYVSIDFITDDSWDPGTLEAYDVDGNLLEAAFTPGNVGLGGVETAVVQRTSNDIAYIVAGGILTQGVSLDNLQYDTAVPEPSSLAVFAGLGMMGLIACRRRRR